MESDMVRSWDSIATEALSKISPLLSGLTVQDVQQVCLNLKEMAIKACRFPSDLPVES